MQRLCDAFGQAVTGAGHPELRRPCGNTSLPSTAGDALGPPPSGPVSGAGLRAGAFAELRLRRALFAHHFIRLGFLGPWRAVVPEAVRPDVFPRLVQALDAEAERHGNLSLDVPWVCISARRR